MITYPIDHHGLQGHARAAGECVEFSEEQIEQSIPERFEKIVRLYPDRVAVKDGNRALTYDELNRQANRIARAILEKRGPGSEPIALLFEHGIDVIAAVMGVLKAGKFYVAVDCACPIERLHYILDDSQTSMLVTNNWMANLSEELLTAALEIINTDKLDDYYPVENVDTVSIPPDALVNITYTSGSTGTPKGVMRMHGRVLRSALLGVDTRGISDHDTLSLVHSVSFGSASTEIFQPLLNGAGLCLFDLKTRGIQEFANFLKDQEITVCHLSPSTFRLLISSVPTLRHLSKLRLMYLSGAPITQIDYDLYKHQLPATTLLEVAMGSTESGYICSAILGRDFTFPEEGSPIGYASRDKKVLILDEARSEVPLGEVGEIAVKGQNLNPGYWRRPELTSEKYLTDPNGGDEKIYLSGDLGRMLPDGFVIHLGRKDLIVKIRGYRVNLSEVENALLEHPGVKEAGVAAWDHESEEKFLAGYVVARETSALNVSELREFLRSKLPDYMVPSAVVFLDALPLTNGKLDRGALPKPDNSRPDLKTPYAAPLGGVEKMLSKIFGEVLSFDHVGIHDNFFDLGGHSLAGARIITRVKEVFGADLAVSDLLESPTVAQMAEIISRRRSDEPRETLDQAITARVSPERDVQPANLSANFSKEEVEQSIPDRFEKIVRLYPERVAVKVGNQVLTYAELNAMANRVGRSIVARRGTHPEPVGLLLENGVQLIAAMLGVLKAGKFFVLLDASFPKARIATVLQDSQTTFLITDQQDISFTEQLPDNRCHVAELINQSQSANDLTLAISADSVSLIYHTSGSTGRPKGVIQTHRNVLHNVMLRTNAYNVQQHDRLSLLSSSTSSAVMNIFLALLNGAALLHFKTKKEGVSRLANWLSDEKISICWMSSPIFRKLAETLTGREEFTDLRLVRLASEGVYKADVDFYKKVFPAQCVLANGLASSESGLLRSYLIDHKTEIVGTDVPVGYAVEDKELLLLDDEGNEVGFNQVGEIVVRSKYLSPGYWNRPELTQTKFKFDPQDSEKRLYYSGDLGLMLPDGRLIHKGRKDFRVKIRGYGVDLTEIEKVLRGHAAITDTVVVGRHSESGEVRLIAYFTSSAQTAPTTSELRKSLSKTLPDYMIPSFFVRLEAIPLTPNGKVDRKALPEPDDKRPELSTAYLLPRNQVERMLVRMWEEVLGVRPVGIDDDFFDLGGDSLKLANMISRVEHELGIGIATSEVLEAPRICRLGRMIERTASDAYHVETGDRGSQYVVNLRVGNGEKRIFCFPFRGGFRDEYFNFCRISRHFSDEYSFYGLRARGAKGDEEPRRTIKEIAADFVKAIVSVQPHGPYFLIGECGGGIPAFEAARQLQAFGEKVELLALFDTHAWSLNSYFWRRLKEPLSYRKRLGLMPASWEYFEKRAQLHLKELRRRKGFAQIRYLLDKFIKVPTAVAYSIEQGKPPATVPVTESPRDIGWPAVSRIRLSEKDYFIAAHRYRYRPYTGRIALLVNEEWHKEEPSLGWQKFAMGGLDVYPIPGDHDHCVPDNIAGVAKILKECLTNAPAT